MKNFRSVVLSMCCLCVGIVYFAWQKQLIIIQLPANIPYSTSNRCTATSEKNVTLYFWSMDSFKHETTTVLFSDDKAQTLHYIISSWLTAVQQAGSISKKVNLETVMISTSGSDVYLSFDRTLFAKNESTFDKWMRVEGLLKTIRAAQSGIARIYFFVHHQQLKDEHLDFTQPWPIHGFSHF